MAQICQAIPLSGLNYSYLANLVSGIGDKFTIPEMFVLPDPIFGDRLDPLYQKIEMISASAYAVAMKFVQQILILPTQFLTEAFESLVPVVSGIWDQIVNFQIPYLNVNFMDLMETLMSNGSNAIQTLIDSIKDKVKSIKVPSLPDPLIPDGFDPLWEATQKVKALINNSLLTVMSMCMSIISMVMEKVQAALEIVGMTLGTPVDQFLSLLTSIPDLITNGINELFDMFSFTMPTVDDLIASVNSQLAKASGMVDSLVDSTVAQVQSQIAAASALIDAKIAAVKALAQGFMDKLTSIFGFDIPGLPDFEGLFGTMADNFWGQLVMFMQNWWTSFTNMVMNVVNAALTELFDKVNAMIAYINALSEDPRDAVISAINAIVGGLMNFIFGLPDLLLSMIPTSINYCFDVPTPSIPL